MNNNWNNINGSYTSEVSQPKGAICWLHGLGANAKDFKVLADLITSGSDLAINWFLPQASSMAVTINQGMVMPAWYDIYSLDDFLAQDLAGMQTTAKMLINWCLQQMALGISPENIILIGFSQGGAQALYTALTAEFVLGLVIGIGTYLPVAYHLETIQLTEVDIIMLHGRDDEVISPTVAQASVNKLNMLLPHTVELNWYNTGHNICHEQLNKLLSIIQAKLG